MDFGENYRTVTPCTIVTAFFMVENSRRVFRRVSRQTPSKKHSWKGQTKDDGDEDVPEAGDGGAKPGKSELCHLWTLLPDSNNVGSGAYCRQI